MSIKGHVENLEGFIDHYPFSKGISHWINRHNGYSSSEANEIIQNIQPKLSQIIFHILFNKDINIKRIYQKYLFYKLPLRPLIKFIILYFLKLGFLDGRAGLKYSLLQTIYEYFITIKVKE